MNDFFSRPDNSEQAEGEALAFVEMHEPIEALDESLPQTREDQAENALLFWRQKAIENFERKEYGAINDQEIVEILLRKHSRTFRKSLAAARDILSQYKTIKDDVSGDFLRKHSLESSLLPDIIELVRSGLSSTLYGGRLSAAISQLNHGRPIFTNEDIENFIRTKINLIFAALAERYRYRGLYLVQISDKNNFLKDISFLISSKIPVPSEDPQKFTTLIFRELNSKNSSLHIEGGWGSVLRRENGLFMQITKEKPQTAPPSSARLRIKTY